MKNTEQKGRKPYFFAVWKANLQQALNVLKTSQVLIQLKEWCKDIWARIKDRMETCKCGGHTDGVD